MIWTQPTLSTRGNTHCINIYSECTDIHWPHCSQAYTILGKDLKVVDLDQDGSLDLIVTAPGVSGWIISIDSIYSAVYLNIHAGPRLCPRHPGAGGQPRPRQPGQQPRGGGGQHQPLLGARVRQVEVYIYNIHVIISILSSGLGQV